MPSDLISGETPRQRYVTALRMLAEQCNAIILHVEAGGYPVLPHGNYLLVQRMLDELLLAMANGEKQK